MPSRRSSAHQAKEENDMIVQRASGRAHPERRLQRRIAELEELVEHDPLTGLLNRRGLDRVFNQERALATYGQPMSAILLDCDDFKSVNDDHGMAAGDAVLREIARRVLECLRPEDHVVRVGGDEFLILLPATPEDQAFAVAERLRLSIASPGVRLRSKCIPVSASFGVVAASDRDLTIEELIVRAHRALSSGKRQGKNRVVGRLDPFTPNGCGSCTCLVEGTGLQVLERPLINLRNHRAAGSSLYLRATCCPLPHPRDFLRRCRELGQAEAVERACLRNLAQAAARHQGRGKVEVELPPTELSSLDAAATIACFSAAAQRGKLRLALDLRSLSLEPDAMRAWRACSRESGIGLTLFGVGHGRTSLEALLALQPSALRIDSHLVAAARVDEGARTTLQGLVRIARTLGAEVLAEVSPGSQRSSVRLSE